MKTPAQLRQEEKKAAQDQAQRRKASLEAETERAREVEQFFNNSKNLL